MAASFLKHEDALLVVVIAKPEPVPVSGTMQTSEDEDDCLWQHSICAAASESCYSRYASLQSLCLSNDSCKSVLWVGPCAFAALMEQPAIRPAVGCFGNFVVSHRKQLFEAA